MGGFVGVGTAAMLRLREGAAVVGLRRGPTAIGGRKGLLGRDCCDIAGGLRRGCCGTAEVLLRDCRATVERLRRELGMFWQGIVVFCWRVPVEPVYLCRPNNTIC